MSSERFRRQESFEEVSKHEIEVMEAKVANLLKRGEDVELDLSEEELSALMAVAISRLAYLRGVEIAGEKQRIEVKVHEVNVHCSSKAVLVFAKVEILIPVHAKLQFSFRMVPGGNELVLASHRLDSFFLTAGFFSRTLLSLVNPKGIIESWLLEPNQVLGEAISWGLLAQGFEEPFKYAVSLSESTVKVLIQRA